MHGPRAVSTIQTQDQANRRELDRLERDIVARVALPASVSARRAAVAAMSALVERLTAGEAHALLAALPYGIGELLEGDVLRRSGRAASRLDRAEWLLALSERLNVTPVHAEAIARAVLGAVAARLPRDVVDNVAQQLPHGLKELWRDDLPPGAVPDSPSDADAARRMLVAEIEESGALPPGVLGPQAFEAVMCLLSEHVSRGEARDVLLSLPDSVRPLLVRCTLHRGEHAASFDRQEFLARLGRHLDTSADHAEQTARAVFAATKRLLPSSEVDDVASQLPPDLRELWTFA